MDTLTILSLLGSLPACEWWERARVRARRSGEAYKKCVYNEVSDRNTCEAGRPNWRHAKRPNCDDQLSKAQFYSCWNSGWPLSTEERAGYRFATVTGLAAYNVSLRPASSADGGPYYVAIGGVDAETRLPEIRRGLCFDVDGLECKKYPALRPIVGRVSPASLVASLQSAGTPIDFDVFKIDVDSIECPLLDALVSAGYRPRLIVAEASPAWPPPLLFRREAAGYRPPACKGREARTAWLYTGGEFYYGCSLQEIYEVLRPHGYALVQYAMEDAVFIRKEHLRAGPASSGVTSGARGSARGRAAGGGDGGSGSTSSSSTSPSGAPMMAGLEPAEAYARGNPHIYFRNNGGNATVSRALLEALGRHGRGRAQALLETALRLFEDHSGLALKDVPHRVGYYSRTKGTRVWMPPSPAPPPPRPLAAPA